LPLLLLPLPTAPPYFLVLFLLTLALHARPCFYCIVLLAALFLSSCYWQSFPLDAHLSAPWAHNVTTFSDALNAALPSHLTTLNFSPPIMRVADRCWCDFASGLFEPYDVQKWEMDSIQRAVAQIEKQWKQSLEQNNANATATVEPSPTPVEQTPNVLNVRNETLISIVRSFFSRYSNTSRSSPSPTPLTDSAPPPPVKPSAVQSSIPAEPSLAPGQLDMRPLGFELIVDLRWPTRS